MFGHNSEFSFAIILCSGDDHVEQHPGIRPMVDDMMAKYQPDIVIMMLGTNDLGLSLMTGDIIPRWEDLVRQIEKQLPENGMILCASFPPYFKFHKRTHVQ